MMIVFGFGCEKEVEENLNPKCDDHDDGDVDCEKSSQVE